MQLRFGAASSLESVRFAAADDPALSNSIEANILAPVRRRAEAVDSMRQIYQNSPSPLHMYGTQFGANAYTALLDLAGTPGQQVKCSIGTPDERLTGIAVAANS